jgi:hypothetical protein
MRILAILLLAFLTSGVGQAQVRKPVPEVQTVGKGVVWRTSGNKDVQGRYLPPWKEIRITNIFEFKRRPVVGEKVTVIPLDAEISPLDLTITKAEKKENPCNERLPGLWEVELEPISVKEFFEVAPTPSRAAEYPFDVAVIYPAVKVARQIQKAQLTREVLPKGVSINTVKAAIDLTDDRKPDVVIVEYCCGDTKKPAGECDYTCGKTFKRTGSGWKLVETSSPC